MMHRPKILKNQSKKQCVYIKLLVSLQGIKEQLSALVIFQQIGILIEAGQQDKQTLRELLLSLKQTGHLIQAEKINYNHINNNNPHRINNNNHHHINNNHNHNNNNSKSNWVKKFVN